MNLEQELQKEEYLPLTNKERLDLLHTKKEEAIGRIEEGKLKLLESCIAEGLWRDKMEDMKLAAKAVLIDVNSTTEQKALAQTKMKIVAGFHEAISEAKLANKAPFSAGGHTINMNDPTVNLTFNAAVSVGLISASEATKVISLAKYNKPLFPDVTLRDVIKHFNPELINEDWIEIEATDGRTLSLQLNSRAPEVTHIVVQMQDLSGAWEHATALHGIQSVRPYTAALPYYGVARKLRWRCEYALDGVVTAV